MGICEKIYAITLYWSHEKDTEVMRSSIIKRGLWKDRENKQLFISKTLSTTTSFYKKAFESSH